MRIGRKNLKSPRDHLLLHLHCGVEGLPRGQHDSEHHGEKQEARDLGEDSILSKLKIKNIDEVFRTHSPRRA
jgi:hypothetical protein